MNQPAKKNDSLARGGENNAQLAGTYAAAAAVNSRMEWAQQNANLISPATSVGRMPEGCGVAITIVNVDAANDTYKVGGGKHGLSKTVLQKLAAALGVSWDPIASGRLDDGSDSNYCRWRAVGTYRAFDGQVQTIVAEKELDLRAGSPTVVALEAQARSSDRGTAEKQVREMRQHIQSHAETKAQLRAIRSLGLKTAYTAEELQRPFVAARIMFTGQTQDPALREKFALMTADSFLSGTRSLYGRSPQGSLADPPSSLPRLAPPPVGTTVADEDDLGHGETTPSALEQSPERRDPPSEERGAAKPAQSRSAGGHTLPFGDEKGTPVTDASDGALTKMAGYLRKQIDGGTSRFPDKDKSLLQAIEAEIDTRAAAPNGDY